MRIYHGTSAHNLDEIAEYGGVLCRLDLMVQRHLKFQKSEDYHHEQLSQDKLERTVWDWARDKKENDAFFEYDRYAYIFVSADPHPGFIRCGTLGVILGFDVPASMIINGLQIHRRLSLDFLNRALYLEKTDLGSVNEALRNYDVAYAFYDYKTGKIHSGERSLVVI